MGLKIIPLVLFDAYEQAISSNLSALFDALQDSAISTENFSFYTSVSAMASSKIEGESLEIDSYVKYKMLNLGYQQDLVEKPNDLYQAYLFAQKNALTQSNFLKAHQLITAHLLAAAKQGKCRTTNMVVMEHKTFRIQYEAAPAEQVKKLFKLFWQDIAWLKKQALSINEVFYFASVLHLVLVNVHPFEDGNGRAGRLLEKWFIAEKLGQKAWYLQSELYYYQHINDYYKNLNRLGIFYDQLNYANSLPFLLMLPNSL